MDHLKYIYNLLHTNNSTVQSIVNSKLLLYPNSVLSENYKYLMSKYKISHLDWNLSLLHVLNKIEVPPLVYMNYLYATLCMNYVSSEITYIHVIFI